MLPMLPTMRFPEAGAVGSVLRFAPRPVTLAGIPSIEASVLRTSRVSLPGMPSAEAFFAARQARYSFQSLGLESDYFNRQIYGPKVIPAAPTSTGWSVANVTPDKSYDADATTVDELADVLGTLIAVLKSRGMLGG